MQYLVFYHLFIFPEENRELQILCEMLWPGYIILCKIFSNSGNRKKGGAAGTAE